MKIISIKKQSGFSILEVVLTIVFFMLFIIAGTSAVGPWITWKQRYDTLIKLEMVKKGIALAYKSSAWQMDHTENPIVLNNSSLHEESAPLPVGITCPTTSADISAFKTHTGWKYLFSYFGTDMATSMTDGFKNFMCVAVSPRLNIKVDNSTVHYHVISFISKGANRELDATDYSINPDTGMLSAMSGDDMMIFVTGHDIQMNNYETVKRKVEKVSAAYQEYFHSRYLMNPQHDESIDYFFTPVGSPVMEIGEATVPTDANTLDFSKFLNLSDSDVSLPWQSPSGGSVPNLIQFSNAFDGHDRFPESTIATMKTAPWSAHIGGRLPGPAGDGSDNNYVQRTVIGVY